MSEVHRQNEDLQKGKAMTGGKWDKALRELTRRIEIEIANREDGQTTRDAVEAVLRERLEPLLGKADEVASEVPEQDCCVDTSELDEELSKWRS